MIKSLETEVKKGPGNVRHMGGRASTVEQFRCANRPSLSVVAGGRFPPFAGDEIRGFPPEAENARPVALQIRTLSSK